MGISSLDSGILLSSVVVLFQQGLETQQNNSILDPKQDHSSNVRKTFEQVHFLNDMSSPRFNKKVWQCGEFVRYVDSTQLHNPF